MNWFAVVLLVVAAGVAVVGVRRRSAAAWGLAGVLGLGAGGICWVLPGFGLPKPTGKYGVGTRTVYVADGGRELAVQVWYPAAGAAGKRARYVRVREVKPLFWYWAGIGTNAVQDARGDGGEAFPVLLFGPMWGGRRTQDTFLAEELASHGYVVAAIDHPGNAARMERRDGTVVRSVMAGALDHLERSSPGAVEAVWNRELAVWVRDEEVVLDALLAGRSLPGVRLDGARVGAFGHSFGGAASVALLGRDRRVKAAANLDGWTFGGIAARTTEPVMFVYEGSAAVRPGGEGVEARMDRDDNAAVDASLRRFGGYRGYVGGTQHLDFTDWTLVSPVQRLTHTGPIAGERVREITRGLLVGFFDEALKGAGAGVPKYPEVKVDSGEGLRR